jgi:hypothetical protein
MAEEEIKPKPVMIDGHEWKLFDNTDEQGERTSVLQKPDGTPYRTIMYGKDGVPSIIRLHAKAKDSPLTDLRIADGKLDEFIIYGNGKEEKFVNDPDKNRILHMTGRESAESVSLDNQNAVIVKSGTTVSRVARALQTLPGQELNIKSPFEFTITKLGKEGHIASGKFPSMNGNILESVYFPDGSVRATREVTPENTLLHAYPHFTMVAKDAKGATNAQYPDFSTIFNADGALDGFSTCYKGTPVHEYQVGLRMGSDGVMRFTETLYDNKGKEVWTKENTPAAEFHSQSDLISQVKTLQGVKAKRDELNQLQRIRTLRTNAISRLHSTLELYDLSVDLNSISAPASVTQETPAASGLIPPSSEAEAQQSDASSTDAPEPPNSKTSFVTLGGKPWKVVQEFDESDPPKPVRAMQYKPNGKPYRQILYVDGKADRINMYKDGVSFPEMAVSLREDPEKPRVIQMDPETGKIINACYFENSELIHVVKYDESGQKEQSPQHLIRPVNPENTEYFNYKNVCLARMLMPFNELDLGLPEYSRAKVLDIYDSGAVREMHIYGKNQSEYDRHVLTAGAEIFSFTQVRKEKNETTYTEMGDDNWPKSRAIVDESGKVVAFNLFHPRANRRDPDEKPTARLRFDFHGNEDRQFDVIKLTKKGKTEAFHFAGKNISALSGAPFDKWGKSVLFEDLKLELKYPGQADRVSKTAIIFDTKQYAEHLHRIVGLPPLEEEVDKAQGSLQSEAAGDNSVPHTDGDKAKVQEAEPVTTKEPEKPEPLIERQAIPAKNGNPAYTKLLYRVPGENGSNRLVKIEERREDESLRYSDEKNPDGSGTITYYWKDKKDAKGNSVPRTMIKYSAVKFEQWNSHIMLAKADSIPVNEKDREFIISHAKDEFLLMKEHHQQDVIIDLKDVTALDSAYVDAIKTVHKLADNEPYEKAWAEAVEKISEEKGSATVKEILDSPDYEATASHRAKHLESITSEIEKIDQSGHIVLAKMLRSLSKKTGNPKSYENAIGEITSFAQEEGVDISGLSLDMTLPQVVVPSTNRVETLAKLRKEHMDDMAASLEAAYAEALPKYPKRKVLFSGVEGRAMPDAKAGKKAVNPSDALKQQLKAEFGDDVDGRILPANQNMRDPNVEDHAFLCITRREDYNTDGKKVYSEDYQDGKIAFDKGKYKFREHEPRSGQPIADNKGKIPSRPLCFDDFSVKEQGRPRA